jgi:hypothetical protein
MPTHLIPAERIERAILLIRGQKVMLDSDLARLYGVPTKVLNQAVRRNPDRFPGDFMFHLNAEEVTNLRSQTVTPNTGRGGWRDLSPSAHLAEVGLKEVSKFAIVPIGVQ